MLFKEKKREIYFLVQKEFSSISAYKLNAILCSNIQRADAKRSERRKKNSTMN